MFFSQGWQLRIIGKWMIERLSLLLILLLVKKFPYLNPLDKSSACTFYNYLIWLIGNILNFNVGAQVDLDIPRSFWSRLAGKYGNIFYWKEKVKVHSQSDTSYVFDSLWNFSFGGQNFCCVIERRLSYGLLINVAGRRCIYRSCCQCYRLLLKRTSWSK